MTNSVVKSVPASPVSPTPVVTETQTSSPALPPLPSIPKEAVGVTAPSIPQEIEIQIDHPGSNNSQTNQLGSPVTETTTQPVQVDPVLPPLPEIQ